MYQTMYQLCTAVFLYFLIFLENFASNSVHRSGRPDFRGCYRSWHSSWHRCRAMGFLHSVVGCEGALWQDLVTVHVAFEPQGEKRSLFERFSRFAIVRFVRCVFFLSLWLGLVDVSHACRCFRGVEFDFACCVDCACHVLVMCFVHSGAVHTSHTLAIHTSRASTSECKSNDMSKPANTTNLCRTQ